MGRRTQYRPGSTNYGRLVRKIPTCSVIHPCNSCEKGHRLTASTEVVSAYEPRAQFITGCGNNRSEQMLNRTRFRLNGSLLDRLSPLPVIYNARKRSRPRSCSASMPSRRVSSAVCYHLAQSGRIRTIVSLTLTLYCCTESTSRLFHINRKTAVSASIRLMQSPAVWPRYLVSALMDDISTAQLVFGSLLDSGLIRSRECEAFSSMVRIAR